MGIVIFLWNAWQSGKSWKYDEDRFYNRESSALACREMEQCHLTSVFERLVAITIHLAERNVEFQRNTG
jgi:hypothetical protein